MELERVGTFSEEIFVVPECVLEVLDDLMMICMYFILSKRSGFENF